MKRIIDFIDNVPVTRCVSSILMMAMAVIMTLNVVLRYGFGFSFNWGDEILRYICVYMSFLGIAAAWRYNSHVRVALFVEKLFPEWLKVPTRILTYIITIVFMAACTYFGLVLVERIIQSGQISPALHLPMYLLYGIVPLTSILSIIQLLLQLFKHRAYRVPME